MYKEILFPVDLDQPHPQGRALQTAIEYCQAFNARLHVVAVIPDFGMSMVGQFFPRDYEKKMRAKANKNLHDFVQNHIPASIVVQHIISESRTIYQEILTIAREIKADLIIISAHRPGLKHYLIGANASRVVRHAKQSVLVVRE